MITIVDYGIGNLGSVHNMFKKLNVPSEITADPERIASASKILLPGVGAFDAAMTKLNESGIREILDRKATVEKVPVLGICLGMQMLTRSSEEGKLPGLGWIEADTLAFRGRIPSELKIPHMGWNFTRTVNENNHLADLWPGSKFYFVHSYYVKVREEEHSLLKCTYGIEFDAAIVRENIFGAQFHPEKSHKFGMRFLQNFANV